MDAAKMRSVAKKAVKSHEQRMHGTKKMKAGGPTSMDMRKMGRNLARAKNQGGK